MRPFPGRFLFNVIASTFLEKQLSNLVNNVMCFTLSDDNLKKPIKMSNVTQKDINKISRLAKIELPQEGCDDLSKQLNDIIGWVDKLNEIEAKDIEPLTNVHGESLRLHKDEVLDGGIAEDVLKNAPDAKYEYFTVPKVIE